MTDNSFDIVGDMLGNEKTLRGNKKSTAVEGFILKEKKSKQRVKYKSVPATEADLKLSGWNLEYDPEYKVCVKEGDTVKIGDGALTLQVIKKASPFKMACVFNTQYSIYGFGKNLDVAIDNCTKNILAWKKAHPALVERFNKLSANAASRAKKTEDKDVAGLLGEAGL